ncbi:MAG: hypothetical protein HY897_08700 [Deltaproteobacteria bacterium]|nr:hypothetical protein [Deltaproteobacteria bacterium]
MCVEKRKDYMDVPRSIGRMAPGLSYEDLVSIISSDYPDVDPGCKMTANWGAKNSMTTCRFLPKECVELNPGSTRERGMLETEQWCIADKHISYLTISADFRLSDGGRKVSGPAVSISRRGIADRVDIEKMQQAMNERYPLLIRKPRRWFSLSAQHVEIEDGHEKYSWYVADWPWAHFEETLTRMCEDRNAGPGKK